MLAYQFFNFLREDVYFDAGAEIQIGSSTEGGKVGS